jgi:hypothetical protein
VDGIVRFDHENDPDDVRLRVDPEGTVELARDGAYERTDANSCLHGAFLHATQDGVTLKEANEWIH